MTTLTSCACFHILVHRCDINFNEVPSIFWCTFLLEVNKKSDGMDVIIVPYPLNHYNKTSRKEI